VARILVAEDSNFVQYVLKRILSTQDYQVYGAKEGHEALQFLKNYPIDLLLLDLRLPGLDGFQLIERIHLTRPKIPFIAISGFIDAKAEVRLKQLGATGILSKPVDAKALLRAVEQALVPARRVLVATEGSRLLEHFREQLERLGYCVELQEQLETVEAQVVHRTFDALVLWSKWESDSPQMSICRNLRARNEWLPIFVPAAAVNGDSGGQLDLIPVPGDDPDDDAFYAQLAARIGLQRTSRAAETALIQLAGCVDREDILDRAIREAVVQRRNILFDLRQATYLSPYSKKLLKELGREAVQYHLQLGLLLGPSAKDLSVEEWSAGPESPYRVFTCESMALKSLRDHRPARTPSRERGKRHG